MKGGDARPLHAAPCEQVKLDQARKKRLRPYHLDFILFFLGTSVDFLRVTNKR